MSTLIAILQVAAGLGFVIFVHELGHFAVAKLCGVRCDKFFVGFDIGGYKLSRKWGETEYGIGILPLGGYVKMFGQDDNAANIAEELEEAKALEGSPDAKAIVGPDGETRWVHRRSYLAKSVPQRMAIISAGVIMNVIFAFVFAWIAFGIGVPETPAVLGRATPGSPTWKADLRTGDRLVSINGVENPTYKQLVEQVILGDMQAGIDCVVDRPGEGTFELNIKPEQDGPAPRIGFGPASRPRLAKEDAVLPNAPASKLTEGFQDGDQIAEINGVAIDGFAELASALVSQKSEALEYTVIRGGKTPVGNPFGPVSGGEKVSLTVEANRMERIGIVPTLGPIDSIQSNSPAEAAGLKPGDQIIALGGVAIGSAPEGEESIDPVVLEDRLRVSAANGESVTLTITRSGEASPVELEVTPRPVTWQTAWADLNAPAAFDSIGVACELRAEVQTVVVDSPAAKAGIKPGDKITGAAISSKSESDELRLPGGKVELKLGEGNRNWPLVLQTWQDLSSEAKVELAITGDSSGASKPRTLTVTPESVDGAFTETRGVLLSKYRVLRTAESPSERVDLAWQETRDSLMQVVKFLQRLGGQVSVKALGGPITIAKTAGGAAYESFGSLLVFLTMLSANLAVLNFLPIPVLDGGHMVFLMYEGITGRQVNERVMIALQVVGLVFILGLMLFVSALDITRLLGIPL